MKLAVVGSGVSGLVAAYVLQRVHDVTLFEADRRIGGHVHTHRVDVGQRAYAVDTGFIVLNTRNYPNFLKLLAQLKVPTQSTSMSFAVHCERTGFEYCGNTLNSFWFSSLK